MLSPEIANFALPKIICSHKPNTSLNSVNKTIEMNSFYKSLVITCPDEMHTPNSIVEMITEDTDYYKLIDCPLTEFVEPSFIENFVKRGNIYCLSADRDCMVKNCVAITPDGHFTLHILDFIYQTLGFEGTSRPHNYYEVKIDLKTINKYEKLKQGLKKLELFDLYLIWEPHEENICPSSIAKYFHDKKIKVTTHSLTMKHIMPDITEVPSIKDVDAEDMVEWIGMLAIGGNLNETEAYISSYSQPQSELALKTTRISVLIVKGFIPASLSITVSRQLSEFTKSRELVNYWTALSVQSEENSLWQWNASSPKMFQAHDNSLNVFFSADGVMTYSVGQLTYS